VLAKHIKNQTLPTKKNKVSPKKSKVTKVLGQQKIKSYKFFGPTFFFFH